MNRTTDHSKPLIFRAGGAASCVHERAECLVFDCALAWLAGPESQGLAHGATLALGEDAWLVQGADLLAGVLVGRADVSLEEATFRLYRRMFDLTHGLNRYRLWNYVPRINAEVGGVENYVTFNAGRHRAYAEQFGERAAEGTAAASALGTQGGSLALVFVAGPAPVTHYESPLQTPAAHYPPCYGKNPPLFARGTKVCAADGSTCWHLSGTASVRGSETVGGDFAQQLNITLENIERMLGEMAVPALRQAAWKVFLRERRDLERCRQRLAAAYPGEVAQMMFLEADICRRDLLLEIEGMFFKAPPCVQPKPKPSP